MGAWGSRLTNFSSVGNKNLVDLHDGRVGAHAVDGPSLLGLALLEDILMVVRHLQRLRKLVRGKNSRVSSSQAVKRTDSFAESSEYLEGRCGESSTAAELARLLQSGAPRAVSLNQRVGV